MRKHIAWRGGIALLAAGMLAACTDGQSTTRHEAFENGVVTLSARVEREDGQVRFACTASRTGRCAFAVQGSGSVERFDIAVGGVLIRTDLKSGFAHCAAAKPGCAIGGTSKERAK